MLGTPRQTVEYRGYRLTEYEIRSSTNGGEVLYTRWEITRLENGIEHLIGPATSLDHAKQKVDEILGGPPAQ